MNKHQDGYVMLISAVIVSAILLTAALTVSLGSFYLRSNGSDFVSKRQSFLLAWSCLDKARLNIAQNPDDPPIGNVTVATDSCQIKNIDMDQPSMDQITITASSTVNRATTILQLIVDQRDLSLISWKELTS